jgi:VCBS repeat protein
MRQAAALALVLSAALAGASHAEPSAAQGPGSRRAALATSFATDFPVAEHVVRDLDGDGLSEILVVGVRGEVRVYRSDASGRFAAANGQSLVLRAPERTLLALADLVGEGRPQLVTMTRDGVAVHRIDANGGYSATSEIVAPRARFALRVGRPRFAPIARDVNGDGRADLVVPRGDECDLWLNGGGAKESAAPAGNAPPAFTKTATVRVEMRHESATRAEALSDVLEESFRIPNLRIEDVNGDGRGDLLVESGHTRAWHLQGADGSFPAAADVTLDLTIFRDTTPEAEVRLGRTLAGGDDQRLETRDLDADGIPDYVIAHRRKVWVFRGTKAGPQFTKPSDILRVADDVTVLMLLRLDEDPWPDLLLVRVQVPTLATLLRGLVSQWDVEIEALGYENLAGRKFDVTPKWKGGATVRLPALLGVLRDPQSLLKRFEDAAKKFREFVEGDFDGDGREDVALVASEADRVEVFAARRGGAEDASERAVGDVLFGDERRTWDLDAILRWLGDVAERRTASRTGSAPPFALWRLRAEAGLDLAGVAAGRFAATDRSELVVAYDRPGSGRLFDLVRIE